MSTTVMRRELAATDEHTRRRIERWALVAGVTGCTANGLLLALWTVALPGNHSNDWTGPANDVIGAVSTLAMIPMALGVRDLLRRPGRLPLLTGALVAGNCALAAASALLVAQVIPFEVQAVVAIPVILAQFAWLRSAGRWGRLTGRLSRRLGRVGELAGTAVLAAVPLVTVAALMPRGSTAQYVIGGTGAALGLAAFAVFPIWQIALSRAMDDTGPGRTASREN
jgi:hypothetical protein